ncbi:MAG: hypothetical protein ACK4N5_20250 [Myxococcales bacterium]
MTFFHVALLSAVAASMGGDREIGGVCYSPGQRAVYYQFTEGGESLVSRLERYELRSGRHVVVSSHQWDEPVPFPADCRPMQPVELSPRRIAVSSSRRSSLVSTAPDLVAILNGARRQPVCSRSASVALDGAHLTRLRLEPCCDVLRRQRAELFAFADERARLTALVARYRGNCVEVGYATAKLVVVRGVPGRLVAGDGVRGAPSPLSFALEPDDVDLGAAFAGATRGAGERAPDEALQSELARHTNLFRVRGVYRSAAALARSGRTEAALQTLQRLTCTPAWEDVVNIAYRDPDFAELHGHLTKAAASATCPDGGVP